MWKPAPGATGERMTADAFLCTSFRDDRPRELVRGWVVVAADWMAGRPPLSEDVPVPPPGLRHGRTCFQIGKLLDSFIEPRRLGTILTNDSGVRTASAAAAALDDGTAEDSVRGPAVLFYSASRLPLDADLPENYLDDPPELVIEVRSPSDRQGRILLKAEEFLLAGVSLVVWADPQRKMLTTFDDAAAGDLGRRVLSGDETFSCPAILPGFSARAADFFRR